VTKVGGGVPYGSTVQRVDYAGEGTRENPFRSYFMCRLTNIAVDSTAFQLMNETEVVVRIRRILVSYSTADAPATGATVKPVVTLYAPSTSSSSLASFVVPLGERLIVTDTPQDLLRWEFDPPIELYQASSQCTGDWDGGITLQCAYYQASDDLMLWVELEWWRE